MYDLRTTLFFLPALLLAFTLLGCDSGGNGGGGNLGDDVTLKVEGSSETRVSWTSTFAYGTGNDLCTSIRTGTSNTGTVPIDETITPSSDGSCPPDGTDATDFDGVRVTVSITGSADLTVQLFSNGNKIDETTEPSQTGTVTTYAVEGGDVPNLGDFSGN